MAFNKDFIDAISLISFMLGIANYDENLSQSDKDDLMKSLDEKTNEMLTRLEKDIDNQNEMIKDITNRLDRIERKLDNERGVS